MTALRQLKKGKSVPNGQPPIESWIQDSYVFANRLSVISQRALCGPCPFVPVGWCSVQLAWLPKPPKPPTKPQNLRSVGLTPGDSKAFLMLLKERLSEHVYAALGDTPQFACRKGVDTSNAILRQRSIVNLSAPFYKTTGWIMSLRWQGLDRVDWLGACLLALT